MWGGPYKYMHTHQNRILFDLTRGIYKKLPITIEKKHLF